MKTKWLIAILIVILLIELLFIFRKHSKEQLVQEEKPAEALLEESQPLFTQTNAPLPKLLTVNKAIAIIETGAREANVAISKEREKNKLETEIRAPSSRAVEAAPGAGNTRSDAAPPESGITIIKKQPTPEESRQMNEKGIIIF